MAGQPPSIRSLQRYCQEGRFDCHKLKTTRSGNPVHEWIINSTSLLAYVRSLPEDELPSATASPGLAGDATGDANQGVNGENPPTVVAPPDYTDDASRALALPRSSEEEPDAMATPLERDDATDGELSRVELLIENARLTSQLDAQSDLVGELREDKRFMREEITQHRKNDRLLADMHRETLQTLKAVAVAGRHTKIEIPGAPGAGEEGEMFRDVPDNEKYAPEHSIDEV